MTTEFLSDSGVIWVSPKVGPKTRTWIQVVYWEVSQEVEVKSTARKQGKERKSIQSVSVQNCVHNRPPPGPPRKAVWNTPWNCVLGCKKLSANSLTSTEGAFCCKFPSMPCKQAKHTLVAMEHPHTETPEFLSCLVELPIRDFCL